GDVEWATPRQVACPPGPAPSHAAREAAESSPHQLPDRRWSHQESKPPVAAGNPTADGERAGDPCRSARVEEPKPGDLLAGLPQTPCELVGHKTAQGVADDVVGPLRLNGSDRR